MTAPVEVEGPGPLDGAGVFSSIEDVGKAAGEQDGVGVAATVAGLDALGMVADPLQELGTAGVGWAIEHFAFLREPLDRLCGDARQIEARAQDWHQISRELATLLPEIETVLAAPDAWTGTAGDAFHGAAGTRVEAARRLSETAHGVADVVLTSASVVGTERAIVRDLIAEFVVWLVPKLLAWAAGAAVTAGSPLRSASRSSSSTPSTSPAPSCAGSTRSSLCWRRRARSHAGWRTPCGPVCCPAWRRRRRGRSSRRR
ncbi:WXG100 family type VII secretion target [Pseudonocardia sp. ICBG1293]|uniref:WXG100 family type VII secretion target n=1 Tax=Pseudonocardia sp. ICBG1293 TaxID=2844382 RepID=UPI001CCF5B91|nr:hypothetical protein [Pseudonocardia sp. ICBG1293]